MNTEEILAYEASRKSTLTPTVATQGGVVDDFVIDQSTTLKKDDLKQDTYLNPIRDYMVARKGVDYEQLDDEKVVDDFVEHMRWFNANTVSTAGEVRFVSNADQTKKMKAKKAYQIYDQLGNVFVNDGAMGAVGGVWDYLQAAAVDPTNYLGILTGGTARFAAAGVSQTGKIAVKELVKKAGQEALKSGATKEAAQQAAKNAGIEAASRAMTKGYTKQAAEKIAARVEAKVAAEGPDVLRSAAERKLLTDRKDIFAKKSLYATTALDSTAAVLQDVMYQNAMLEVNAQESYSGVQTAFSSFLGGVAGAAQLGFGKFRGASGFADVGDPLENLANTTIEQATPFLKKSDTKRASKEMVSAVNTWAEKVAMGNYFEDEGGVTAALVKHIIIGEDGKGGIGKVIKDQGYKIDRNLKTTDFVTNVIRYMPYEDIEAANKLIKKHTGIHLGELDEVGINMSDLISARISDAGKQLNVMSQLRKTLDISVVRATDDLDATLKNVEKNTTPAEKKEYLKYTQGVWKRLLVSSPATTALNVAGFGQYAAGQTLADIFNAGLYGLEGVAKLAANDRTGASVALRRARSLTMLQAQKAKNLMDPYTTRDAYLQFLEKNPDIQKALFETFAGGVEATAKRHGINPDSPVFKQVEAVANAANTITGVRIQDTFTKSQMFMSEMDKALRLKHDKTLREVLNTGEEVLLDDDIMQSALDTTLKSVFSKDYTAKNQPELVRSMAKGVETISNMPGLGTILPFGRFFNNVLATAVQWSPLAGIDMLARFTSRAKRRLVNGEIVEQSLSEQEAFSRMLVGTTALGAASLYDQERRDKGLAYNEIDVGGGTIVDAKNTYPFSAFLAAGRIINMIARDEEVPTELMQEMGTQLAVGQLARDAQFGNDFNNLMDIMLNQDQAARKASAVGLAKLGGNFVSGFTRPLDAVNKIAGFAMGTDAAKDVRQADGAGQTFSLAATKYVDNLFEMFDDKIDAVTGEELRVATREGTLQDANPFARIFGLTVKPGRTATEKAYSMAEMFPWQANERTKLPGYDKTFNSILAPTLEKRTQRLLRTSAYKDGDLTQKRTMLKKVLSDTKKAVRNHIKSGHSGREAAMQAIVVSAERRGTKEIRRAAKKLLKEREGVTANPQDMNYQELAKYIQYIDYLKDIYEAAADI
tara:strand:+ start:1540 stop:5016 length:3477 start_codon:yes stop_codon:yes gene_type:complete